MAGLLMKVSFEILVVILSSGRLAFAGHPVFPLQDITSITKFSNLFYLLFSEFQPEANLIMSPISTAMSLALLSTGAKGETRDELMGALYMNNDNQTEALYREFLEITASQRFATLKPANKIYFQSGYTVAEKFKANALQTFATEVEAANFRDNYSTAQTINTWVKNNTNNTIKDIVTANMFDDSTRLVLVNALYFQGYWEIPFEPRVTTVNQNFYQSNGNIKYVRMMSRNGYYRYGRIPELDARLVDIPYKQRDFWMTIVLPNKINSMATIQNNLLASTNWKRIFESYFDTLAYMKLSIPIFRTVGAIDLRKILPDLGVNMIFDKYRSQLNPILPDFKDTLYVTDAIQKVFIDVNEQGTTAGVAIDPNNIWVVPPNSTDTSPKPSIFFVASHPFLYLIRNRRGHILFMGRYMGHDSNYN